MIGFKNYLSKIVEQYENKPQSTQIVGTKGTYTNTGTYLKNHIVPGSKVISIGAGLDQTREGLKSGLGDEYEVHDHEPYPEKRKKQPEYVDANDIPSHHYDAAVTHNVLNVVEPHIRDSILHHVFRSVKEGGHAIIGTRGWKGDIEKVKSFEPAKEEKAIWVKKPKNVWAYQKGFDGDELKNYIEDFAKKHGHVVKTKRISNLAKNTVHVHIIKKGIV